MRDKTVNFENGTKPPISKMKQNSRFFLIFAREAEKILEKTISFNFCANNFLIFLEAQMHEPKKSKKAIFECFGDGVLVFSGEILLVQRSSLYKRKRWVLQI